MNKYAELERLSRERDEAIRKATQDAWRKYNRDCRKLMNGE